MSKRQSFWDAVPQDAEGEIVWPGDLDSREAFALEMLGARVVGAVEAVYEKRLALIDNTEQRGAGEERPRAVFASMTDEQRTEVKRIVKDACFSTLYWMLVKLKDYPGGTVDITVTPFAADGTELPAIRMSESAAELHHHYFGWIEKFSNHGDGGKW